jgi:ferric-dicitrate binding protein FerR (iron transport regulator)
VTAPTALPRRSARAHPQAVLALLALGAVAAVGLWWTDTPSIHGLGDWLTNAGRITGLLAATRWWC